jgi:hypothetical protein
MERAMGMMGVPLPDEVTYQQEEIVGGGLSMGKSGVLLDQAPVLVEERQDLETLRPEVVSHSRPE